MADITDTLARIVNTQADEIARLRKINDGLVADGREQAATIRTLIDQRGVVAEVAPIDLRGYWENTTISMGAIGDKVGTRWQTISAIIDGEVEPIGALRQRIEALIGGEVGNGG